MAQIYQLCQYVHNMGDLLAPILTERLFDCEVTRVYGAKAHERSDVPLLAGLGSMLANFQNLRVHVWGAGYEPGYVLRRYSGLGSIRPQWQIHAVRGPHTRALLRAPTDTPLGDPALLIKEIYSPNTVTHQSQRYFLHCNNDGNGMQHLELPASTTTRDPFVVIDEITSSDFVFTEALHVAIIAQAFGIPWAWSFNTHRIGVFKWFDWFASINIEPVSFHFSQVAEARTWADQTRKVARVPDVELLRNAFPDELL